MWKPLNPKKFGGIFFMMYIMKVKNIPIIFENNNFLVINKPARVSVHGDGKNDEYTIADWVLENYPEIKDVGEPFNLESGDLKLKAIPRPGIVHRLDKDTSGILIIAKDQETFLKLKDLFMNREMKKTYEAFTYGWPKEDKGAVNESIARSRGDIRRYATGKGKRGEERDAFTEYETILKIGKSNKEKGSVERGDYAFMRLFPKTGRTHQLRIHLKHLNNPIVADPIYAPKREKSLGFERLALHAREINFTLDGEKFHFLAPYPEDFEKALGLANAEKTC